MLRRLLPLALFTLWGASGCGDDAIGVATSSFRVEPQEIDFGVVELGQQKTEDLVLRNIATIFGKLESIQVQDDCSGCIVAFGEPGTVESLGQRTLTLRFRAVRLSVATATVTLATDDPENPEIDVYVRGRGTDTRAPDIEVQPERIDLGLVPAGGVALSSFVIRSTGTNDLLLDRISIDPPDAPFRITTSTPTRDRPGVMRPGAQASVTLRASLPASATGTVSARILIETNVVKEKNVPGRVGVVAVPITANPNLPPVAVVGPEQTVEPWSRVTLDGSGSYDQDNPPNEPLSYRWQFRTLAPGSTTVLERARTTQPSFWIDVTGRYEIELVVTDSLGLESAPAVAVVDALPTNAIRIELTWDHPDSDLDLHLLQLGGAFCDCATDVHYRECGRTPNWFPSTPGANPRLDVDDRAGFGPENINIDGHGADRFVPSGRYQIAVHYYSTNEGVSSWPTTTSNATVRVFFYGLLAGQFTRALTQGDDLWFAAEIQWPEIKAIPLDSYSPGVQCGAF